MDHVLGVRELIEIIFSFADPQDVLHASAASRFFRDSIAGSYKLKRHLFQLPAAEPLIRIKLRAPNETRTNYMFARAYCSQEQFKKASKQSLQNPIEVVIYSPISGSPIFNTNRPDLCMIDNRFGYDSDHSWIPVTICSVPFLRLNPFLVKAFKGPLLDSDYRSRFVVKHNRLDARRTAYSWPPVHESAWRNQLVTQPPVTTLTVRVMEWTVDNLPQINLQPDWIPGSGSLKRGYYIPEGLCLVNASLVRVDQPPTAAPVATHVGVIFQAVKNKSGVTIGDLHDSMTPYSTRKTVHAALSSRNKRVPEGRGDIEETKHLWDSQHNRVYCLVEILM